MIQIQPLLLSTSEAAKALSMSEEQLLELVERGEIPCRSQGIRRKVRRFRWEDLRRYADGLERWAS